MPRVKELWVFPIKSCQGTKVETVDVVRSGFALDRQWCIIDVEGARYPACEFLSQRKMACLASIAVEIRSADKSLRVTAPGMSALDVPIEEKDYANNEAFDVVCGGISTTDPSGSSWVLGKLQAKSAGSAAEQWFTEYLNRIDKDRVNRPKARYVLVRMPEDQTRVVSEYAGPTATDKYSGIPGADCSIFGGVRPGDGAAFHDFGPFLLTSQSSVDWVNEQMGTHGYPVVPFRGSIVVDECPPWDEEEWLEFNIGPLNFTKIKECPRCSIPTRNQETGEFLFNKGTFNGVKGSKLQVTLTLKNAFPEKASDAEWGTWKGPFFGVYVGHNGQEGTMSVGAEVEVLQRREQRSALCSPFVAVPLALTTAAASWFLYRRYAQ